VVKPPFGEKSKKPLFYGLLIGGAALVISIYPAKMVHAGFFSTLFTGSSSFIQTTNASTPPKNSQTVRLLQPAVNIDPNPSKGGGDINVVAGGTALLPESGPSGTSGDIEHKPTSSTISVYIVREGDSLSEIASMFDVTKETIIWANDLKKGAIHEGQTLIILPITGVRHTVGKGETLATIAKKYKADAREIIDYNGLPDTAALTLGSIVIIPDGVVVQTIATVAKKPSISKKINPLRGSSTSDLGAFFAWPVEGGVRTQGLHGYNGVDIGAPNGTPIYAAAGGTVIVSRDSGWNGGYGDYVVIAHNEGVQTLYAHMSAVSASAGSSVSRGEIIGYVGNTGKSTGQHLHFEVRGAKNPF